MRAALAADFEDLPSSCFINQFSAISYFNAVETICATTDIELATQHTTRMIGSCHVEILACAPFILNYTVNFDSF